MTPILTYTIIGITALLSFNAFGNRDLLQRLMLNPYQVKYEKDYYRLLSHGFIHANTLHLFFNMFVLWSFGSALETLLIDSYGVKLGRLSFIILYFGSILAASYPAMRKHKNNPAYNSLGASGAVSAVLIVTMIIFPLHNIFFFFISMKAYMGVALFFIFEIIMNKRGQSFIAHDAHIYGAYFGVLFLLILDYHYILDFGTVVYRDVISWFS